MYRKDGVRKMNIGRDGSTKKMQGSRSGGFFTTIEKILTHRASSHDSIKKDIPLLLREKMQQWVRSFRLIFDTNPKL
jgi:hypothetical protein